MIRLFFFLMRFDLIIWWKRFPEMYFRIQEVNMMIQLSM